MDDAPLTDDAAGLPERKWPFFGYAPGNYLCRCPLCGEQFTGDKRAFSCLPCAEVEAAASASSASTPPVEDGVTEALWALAKAAETWAYDEANEPDDDLMAAVIAFSQAIARLNATPLTAPPVQP